MPNELPSPVLGYGKQGRIPPLRRWARLCAVLAIIALGVAIVAHLYADFMVRWKWMRAERHLRNSVPADTVLSRGTPGMSIAWDALSPRPAPWSEFDNARDFRDSGLYPYVYLGFRTDSAGVSKIVTVLYHVDEPEPAGPGPLNVRWRLGFKSWSCLPVTLWSEPRPRHSGPRWTETALSPIDTKFVLYAGQPDPVDASRFTIDCDGEAGRRTVDGQLLPDGTVSLVPRPGPTTAASSTRQSQ